MVEWGQHRLTSRTRMLSSWITYAVGRLFVRSLPPHYNTTVSGWYCRVIIPLIRSVISGISQPGKLNVVASIPWRLSRPPTPFTNDDPTTAMWGLVLGDDFRREPEDDAWVETGTELWPMLGSSSFGAAEELAPWGVDWVGQVPRRESWLLFTGVSEAIISSRLGRSIWVKLTSPPDTFDTDVSDLFDLSGFLLLLRSSLLVGLLRFLCVFLDLALPGLGGASSVSGGASGPVGMTWDEACDWSPAGFTSEETTSVGSCDWSQWTVQHEWHVRSPVTVTYLPQGLPADQYLSLLRYRGTGHYLMVLFSPPYHDPFRPNKNT